MQAFVTTLDDQHGRQPRGTAEEKKERFFLIDSLFRDVKIYLSQPIILEMKIIESPFFWRNALGMGTLDDKERNQDQEDDFFIVFSFMFRLQVVYFAFFSDATISQCRNSRI